jgi:hypothetical protein
MSENKLEVDIQREIVEFLRARTWHVERMSADAFQNGIPDLFCYHRRWGMRWVEVKRPEGYSFTQRQKQRFPQWEKAGIGIWILTAATQEQYDLLFKAPNWRDFWRPSFQLPGKADVDKMIDNLAREYQESQEAEQQA